MTTSALNQPLPSRRQLRAWLDELRGRSTAYAVALSVLDLLLFGALFAASVLAPHPLLQVLAGLACGFVIARLFIIGHDACHQALTSNKRLNRILGRIVFLPSLTPYSLWEVGHNVVHHGYTNLKGFDFVWAPLTPAEYAALPRWRQTLERVYRSGLAPGLYYFVEVWWLRMMFADRRYLGVHRRAFTYDRLLVGVTTLAWIGGLWLLADATAQSFGWLLVVGFVIPQIVWNTMIGFVVYVHHTHPSIVWHADKRAWSEAVPFVSTTVHLRMPAPFGSLLHHIMEHTAHHVDMGIPLYHLRDAQRRLEARLPGRIVIQDFSWRWYRDTARRCQLFDLKRQCWTDFDGVATS